jgi:hypothetical protein
VPHGTRAGKEPASGRVDHSTHILNIKLGLVAGLTAASFAATTQAHAAQPVAVAVDNGTLNIDGHNGPNTITLRLAPGSSTPATDRPGAHSGCGLARRSDRRTSRSAQTRGARSRFG